MDILEFFHKIAPANKNVAASLEEIRIKEQLLDLKIPADLRLWYELSNGLIGNFDCGMWRFFSLNELNTIKHYFPGAQLHAINTRINNKVASGDCLIFSDQHVGIPYYAVSLCDENHPVFALYPNGQNFDCCLVAENFSNFEHLLHQLEPDFDLSIKLLDEN